MSTGKRKAGSDVTGVGKKPRIEETAQTSVLNEVEEVVVGSSRDALTELLSTAKRVQTEVPCGETNKDAASADMDDDKVPVGHERLEIGSDSTLQRLLKVTERPSVKPVIAPMKPPTDLLNRLNAFLPQIKAANAKLEEDMKQVPAESLSVEHVPDEDVKHVEMDLFMGFLEEKNNGPPEITLDINKDKAKKGGKKPMIEEVE